MLNLDPVTKAASSEFMTKWDGKIDQNDFTFSYLNGQFRCTPEFIQDLAAYYDIEPETLLGFVSDAIKENDCNEEVDIHITTCPPFFKSKEMVFRISVKTSSDKKVLKEKFFSGLIGPEHPYHPNYKKAGSDS